MSGLRPAASAQGRPRLRWIELDELERRQEEWHRLAAESSLPVIYNDPGWLLPWWQHYGTGSAPWTAALEDEEGALLGVAPLALTPGRARTLSFAAQEWNGIELPAVRPEHEQLFASELLTALAQRGGEWDLLRIRRLPLDAPLARLLIGGSAPVRAGAHDVRLQPYIDLPADVAAFEARFGSKQRGTQRRKWRKLLDAGAQPRLIDDPVEAAPAIRALIALRRGRAEALGQRYEHMDERFERFLVAVVERLLPDAAPLWVLELDGEPLAMRLNFVQGPREHSYILGLADGHQALSPGSGIERHAIFQAIEHGRTEFDLGPGRDEYKYRLGGVDRELTRLVAGSPTARGRVFGAAAALDVRLRDSELAARLRSRRGVTPERETPERPRVAPVER